MKRLAWRLLSGCLLAVLAACTGAATPSSSGATSAFGYLAPGATGPDGRKLTLRPFLQLAPMLTAWLGDRLH
jgi:hypothetical protein